MSDSFVFVPVAPQELRVDTVELFAALTAVGTAGGSRGGIPIEDFVPIIDQLPAPGAAPEPSDDVFG